MWKWKRIWSSSFLWKYHHSFVQAWWVKERHQCVSDESERFKTQENPATTRETDSYLAMPKSDTFTTRASFSRQFLAAYRESTGNHLKRDEKEAPHPPSVLNESRDVTRSRWMKLLDSRYSIPSHTSRHMLSKEPGLKLPCCRLRKFSRQPCSMNSVMMKMGRFWLHTPYSCTSLGWDSFLENTDKYVVFLWGDWKKTININGFIIEIVEVLQGCH